MVHIQSRICRGSSWRPGPNTDLGEVVAYRFEQRRMNCWNRCVLGQQQHIRTTLLRTTLALVVALNEQVRPESTPRGDNPGAMNMQKNIVDRQHCDKRIVPIVSDRGWNADD